MPARLFERLSLRNKLISSFVFAILIATAISSAVTYLQGREAFFAHVRQEGSVLTETLAQGAVDPILRNDFSTLEEYVDNLSRKENIVYAIIADRHDHVLAGSHFEQQLPPEVRRRGLANTDPVLVQTYWNERAQVEVNDISVPVMIDGRKWGSVRVGFSLDMVERRLHGNLPYVLLSALLSVTGGIVVALVLTRTITRPLEEIIRSMRIISRGELTHSIEIASPDELGQMAESFNGMARSLGESKAQLERTYKELAQKQKMAALGEFSARLAHEIKNPLGIIRGSAQIVVDEKTPSAIRSEVGRFIIEETDRLNQKVMDILSYARPSVREFRAIDLNALVESNRGRWETANRTGGTVALELRLTPQLPVVQGDGDLLARALLNLIMNAYEAIEGDGTITIETRHDGNGWVAVSVTDTGAGIDPQHVDRFFEPFFTTKPQGTGLGLSIVKSIVESHQGRLRLTRLEPHGTDMTLLLPVSTQPS